MRHSITDSNGAPTRVMWLTNISQVLFHHRDWLRSYWVWKLEFLKRLMSDHPKLDSTYGTSSLLKKSLRVQACGLVRIQGAILKVCVHPSKKGNAEAGPARKPHRARPETHICCALPLGKGTTLSVETKHITCTFQVALSMQRLFQQAACFRSYKDSSASSGATNDMP
jgi:hypothetical protein